MNTDINIKMTWFGCFADDVNVMYFEYNGKKFRILITSHFNDEPSFYPQYVDEVDGAIDFALEKTEYTYDECIELIKNFE